MEQGDKIKMAQQLLDATDADRDARVAGHPLASLDSAQAVLSRLLALLIAADMREQP